MGESLGGAVAIDLASRRPVAGLVTFSTFTSMAEVAARRYPFVPTGLLLQSRFDSRAKLAQVRCPVLLGHGESDRLIPAGMCDGLCGVAGGPVTRISVTGAGHNDLFEVGGEQVTRALRRFLAEVAAGRPR
jgi:fermentation-respiration switch protein FrsA (DUF1100 family)